jgi:hypothetical protein
MTAPEVAEFYHLALKHVERYAASGRFSGAIKTPGGQWRIPRATVTEMVASTYAPVRWFGGPE